MMVGRPISLEIERPEVKSELKKELCEIIAGLRKASDGTVTFQGKSILGMSPREMTKQGIRMSFIPEDRLGMGLVGGLDIVDNILLKSFRCGKGPLLDRTSGNIQKVLLGREIDLNPQLLITSYPVRGLDIGASYFIYETLNKQKEKGVGILFIGYNPFSIFFNIVKGSTGTAMRIQGTINKAIPLTILSLGVAVAFRMKFWNIGAEGQFYIGAMSASWVAFNFSFFKVEI